MEATSNPQPAWRTWVGLLAAPLAFFLLMLIPGPAEFTPDRRAAAGLTLAMAILWVFESIPLAATALLPLVVLPAFSVLTPTQLADSYGNDLIFLFLGGFIIANGIEHHGVHRRLSSIIVRQLGHRPRLLIAGLMFVTMAISFFVSNTATALLMIPIGVSVIRSAKIPTPGFATAMILGIAAACSIGGFGTPIGSTPNLLFTAEIRNQGLQAGFAQWMLIGTPLAIIFTFCAWALLTFWLFPTPSRIQAPATSEPPGPIQRAEILAGLIVALTTLAWIFREDRLIAGTHVGLNAWLPAASDGTIAIAGALAMVLIPVSFRPLKLLTPWETAFKIPWDVILMFGGGLAMAQGIQQTTLNIYLAQSLNILQAVPPWLVLVIACFVGLTLSEVASNTAAAALLLPITSALAVSIGKDPIFLMLPIALSTSLGFMLPVATPPNALALATGEVSVRDMIKTGIILDILGILLIILAVYTLGFPAYQVSP